MKSDYWNVSNEQVLEKTGQPLDHWMEVLHKFGAKDKKPNQAVSHLQNEFAVPRYWARTLTTCYLKQQEG